MDPYSQANGGSSCDPDRSSETRAGSSRAEDRGHMVPQSPSNAWMSIEGERILVRDELKYLRVTLNGRLNFKAHSSAWHQRYRLKRKGEMSLYGRAKINGTIWGADLGRQHYCGRRQNRRVQRQMAIRKICAYRTVPYEMALAGLIPFHVLAEIDAELY
ncbi:unnamed protein product [Heterotrigona itama]|uniref:Uncharacterized protein n=1 Tax=Heterotrigona itama TaxID=395501 RepID=A0A6V7GYS9_9HYME|nr:unnamed protein product [Heterotrigona itama]